MNSASSPDPLSIASSDADRWIAALRDLNTPTDRVFLDPEHALAFGHQALHHARSADMPLCIAHALLIIGGATAFMDRVDEAEPLLADALDRFRALDDPWGIAMTTLRFSLIWTARERSAYAIARLREALAYAERLDPPDEALTISIMNDMGNHFHLLGQHESALSYLTESRQRSTALGNEFHEIVAEINLVSQLLEQHDFDHVSLTLRAILAVSQRTPEYERLTSAIYTLLLHTEISREDGDLSLALSYAAAYRDLTTRFHSPTETSNMYRLMAEVHRRLGNHAEAADALQTTLEAQQRIDGATPRLWIVLTQYQQESLNDIWSSETYDALRAEMDHLDSAYPPARVEVLDALADLAEHLGDPGAALAYLRSARAISEAYLKDAVAQEIQQAAKAHQTKEAQRIAERERAQREALERAMNRIVELNAQNERMVHELREKSAALDALARTDALTGLGNRRHFDERLHQEIERAVAFSHPIAVGMLDLDDFKPINDEFSHLVGDDVLRTIGAIIRQNIRTTDVGARYGGDEFAIILTEATEDVTQLVTKRIQASIAAHDWATIAQGLRVAVSIGFVTDTALAGSSEVIAADLTRRADAMLYEAKQHKERAMAN